MRKVFTTPGFEAQHDFIASLPERFERGEGKIIYDGRNQLREFTNNGVTMAVKSFCLPKLINRIAYGFLRSSKAQRSCEYAQLLLSKGIATPAPIGYVTERKGLLFGRSYYASVKSDYTHNFYDAIQPGVANRDKFLVAVAKTTARLHECGFLHKDYSAGNILLRELEDGTVRVEIIDLNRIRFHKIGLEEGCKNFERLPVSEGVVEVLAETYATDRGFDKQLCCELIEKYTPYKL
jgi:hypothetical protein